MNHIIHSFILVSKCFKSTNMLINWSLTNIATTRKRNFKSSKSFEESWEEKYSNTDFFYQFCIEIIKAHLTTVERKSIISKINFYIE